MCFVVSDFKFDLETSWTVQVIKKILNRTTIKNLNRKGKIKKKIESQRKVQRLRIVDSNKSRINLQCGSRYKKQQNSTLLMILGLHQFVIQIVLRFINMNMLFHK